MVRRALLERADQLAADDEALPRTQPHSARSGQVASHWRGSGGRWLIWVGRAVVWAVLLIVGYRGVLAIIQGQGSPQSAATGASAATAGSRFPVSAAEAYALEFGNVYLNFSPATAIQRSRGLASFLPPGTSPQLGWNGAGTERVLDDQVAAVSVTSADNAVVTLLARLSSGSLVELGVPVYAAQGGMSVSGDPALLPGPATAVPPALRHATSDRAVAAALQSQLPAFFQAYAGDDGTTLARFAAPGAHIYGLGGGVSFDAIDSVYAPAGGDHRQVDVTVTWELPSSAVASAQSGNITGAPAALPMTYQLTVVREGNGWDVESIGPVTQGPP